MTEVEQIRRRLRRAAFAMLKCQPSRGFPDAILDELETALMEYRRQAKEAKP